MKTSDLVILFIPALFTACSVVSGADTSGHLVSKTYREPQFINGNEDAYLEDSEKASLERKALLGDGVSALRVKAYEVFFKGDLERGEFWQVVALEDGDFNAMLQEAESLSKSHNPDAWLRARFWLKKLDVDPNYHRAVQVLQDKLNSKPK